MRRAALALVATVVGLVLLLGFKSQSPMSTASPPAAVSAPTGSGSSRSGSTSSPSGTGSGQSGGTAGQSGTAAGTKVTGSSVGTQYGPVQVQVTVANKKITAVTALRYPTSTGRDQQINSYAIPVLKSETLSAQNANIDMVSGATYTSLGYIKSLQSALDQAGL
jgi:uncharacterized protein with FMN-binding domain